MTLGKKSKTIYADLKFNRYMTDDKNHKSGNGISKFCIHDNCNKEAIYNYWGMQPKYCIDHKKEYHENIYENPVTGFCDYDKCDKPAKYNIRGLKPRYCFEHKNIFHVITPKKYILKEKPNVNKCNEYKLTAIYNFPELRPLKCLKHRKKGMVNINKKHILCKIHDISYSPKTTCPKCKVKKSIICDYYNNNEKCNITASYNFPELRPLECFKHRKKGMVNIKRNHILCKIHDISHSKKAKCKKCKLDIDNYDTSLKYMQDKIFKDFHNNLIEKIEKNLKIMILRKFILIF